MKIIEKCSNPECTIIVTRYVCNNKSLPKYVCCSNKCRGTILKESFVGEKNPNFGKKWSPQKKRSHSEKIKNKFIDDEEYKWKCGASNRGKKFSEERRKNMSSAHMGITRSPHSEEAKEKIGTHSRERRKDKEYCEKLRKTHENNGNWIKLEDKSDVKIYYKESNWNQRMWDIVEDPNDLLKTFGIFNNRYNTSGVVRDHKLSRRTGFECGVYPEILRHPCNCQILTHSDNIKKKKKRYVDEDSINVDELFKIIKLYVGQWHEQNLVLERIKDYESGGRWNRHS